MPHRPWIEKCLSRSPAPFPEGAGERGRGTGQGNGNAREINFSGIPLAFPNPSPFHIFYKEGGDQVKQIITTFNMGLLLISILFLVFYLNNLPHFEPIAFNQLEGIGDFVGYWVYIKDQHSVLHKVYLDISKGTLDPKALSVIHSLLAPHINWSNSFFPFVNLILKVNRLDSAHGIIYIIVKPDSII